MEPLTQVHITYGVTSLGHTLDVTYRCVGQPHVWQYLSLRQLTREELQELLVLLPDVLMPGHQPPPSAGQTALSV